MEIYSEPWFRTRLDYYLRERHPQLQYRAQLLDRRSAVAADLYRRTCDAGGSAECALRLADRSLFRGLLFSKFDTIDLILANDFPASRSSPAMLWATTSPRVPSSGS